MATQGGPAKAVSVQTTGQRQGGAAIPVAVVTDGRAVEGGPAQPVYVVTSGPVQGGPALPIVAAAAGRTVQGGAAIPVYVVSGSLSGGVPVNTVLPVISGTLAIGQLLSTTNGTWTNTPTSYSYQWYRGGVAIGGETNSTYTLTASDPGTAITVIVTATNASGSASATSAAVNPSSLLTSLVAYYQLEEASGTRADATGRGNNLSPTNAPNNAVGIIGNAANLAVNQYLSRASNSDLVTGDIDWMVWCWFWTSVTVGFHDLVCKTQGAANREFELACNGANTQFIIYDAAGAQIGTRSVAFTASAWNLAIGWRDKAANTINLKVNNGATSSIALTGTPGTSTAIFAIGANPLGASFFTGIIDETGLRKALPSAAELTSLWSGGAGLTYPFDGSVPEIGGTTIYVDGNLTMAYTGTYSILNRNASGTDGIGYKYLDDALLAIDPSGTLNLRTGTYTGLTAISSGRQACFVLTKPVTIQAYNSETATITYPAGTPPIYDGSDYGPIVYVATTGATMTDLVIVGTHAEGDSPGGGDLDCNVLVESGAQITLDTCTLTDFGHCGAKGNAMMFVDCTIQDGGFDGRDHCVYVSAPGTVTISGTTLQRAAGYGAHLYGTPQGVVIQNCTITDNGTVMAPNAGGGILCGGNGGHQLTNNQITANNGYGGIVLWKQPSVGNVFTNNTITGNLLVDVMLDDAIQPQTQSGNTVSTFGTNTDYAAWPH